MSDSPAFTLRQLEIFAAAVKAGSFAGASQKLFITPTAVGDAVGGLEKILHVQLVIRRRARGIVPTAAGHHLLGLADALLHDALEVQHAIADGDTTLSGPLAIGCYSTLSATVLPELIDSFTALHPRVDLQIEEGPMGTLAQRLFQGELDLVVTYRLNLPPGLNEAVLYETAVHALLPANHPLANADAVSLEDLSDLPLIMFDLPPSGEHTLDMLQHAGFNPAVAYRSPNLEFVRSMVARGLGYSLLIQKPKVNVSYEGLPMVTKRIEPQFSKEWAVITWPRDARLTDRARAFITLAAATVQQTLTGIPHE